jgi:hypothetical protein
VTLFLFNITIKTYGGIDMIQFKDLPIEIQQRMLDEQERQGNPRDANVFEKEITAIIPEGGFLWEESVEGFNFWKEIIWNRNFAVFYEKYPKESDKKLYSEEEVRNLFIKHYKDLYTTNGKFYRLFLELCLKWFEENKK